MMNLLRIKGPTDIWLYSLPLPGSQSDTLQVGLSLGFNTVSYLGVDYGEA